MRPLDSLGIEDGDDIGRELPEREWLADETGPAMAAQVHPYHLQPRDKLAADRVPTGEIGANAMHECQDRPLPFHLIIQPVVGTFESSGCLGHWLAVVEESLGDGRGARGR